MASCALCGKIVDKECPRCSYPDALIERKHNKHDGKHPTKDKLGVKQGDSNAPYKWPKFKPGQPMPKPPDADRSS